MVKLGSTGIDLAQLFAQREVPAIVFHLIHWCQTGELELEPMRLARLGAPTSSCFLFSLDRTSRQYIH